MRVPAPQVTVKINMVLVKCRQNVANKLFITRVFNPVHPALQQTDSTKCSADYSISSTLTNAFFNGKKKYM